MPARHVLTAAVALLAPSLVRAADPASDEFFESRVRPVLADHCYRCHADNGKEPKGGLRVDGRPQLLAGGDGGPAVVPGNPADSKLIRAVRYDDPDLLMPPKGKLPDKAIADLEAWVKAGAKWPGAAGAVAADYKKEFDLAGRKSSHWSWASIRRPAVPSAAAAAVDPVDKFLLAKLSDKGLGFAKPADPATWLRRVSFALTGLPPAPADVTAFLADPSPAARAAAVDRLLASPHFGERWGRHWLDLVRYAETRGHEFDFDIPNAWQYRDYVVRALNADVPYDRLVVEHLAGDLLPDPRLDPATGANESVVGSGFWQLGEEVHSPVDVRQDQADRLDNRIDVFAKAFLGLTVSCARCHDHKFDAIGTRDFYALYGLLQAGANRQVRVDGWAANRKAAADLADLRDRATAAADLKPTAPPADPAFEAWLKSAKVVVDYAAPKPGDFLPDDVTFGPGPRPAGAVTVRRGKEPTAFVEDRPAAAFDRFWAGLRTAPGTQGEPGSLGPRPRAGFTLRTPTFTLERDNLYYLVRGGGLAYAAACGHSVVFGPLHGPLVMPVPNADGFRWVEHKLGGYRGLPHHVELTADPNTEFAVAMVVQADSPPPAVPPGASFPPPDEAAAKKLAADTLAAEADIAKRVVWSSRLAPAVFEGPGFDERVFVRGSPKSPGDVVPRRFLEALAGPGPLPDDCGGGRLDLARQVVDPGLNPFVARVAVNRVWHHLFGRGLVASTDNFGVLGEPPTHPELLDHLADSFVADRWSLKRLVRRLVLTAAYGQSSDPVPAAADADPANLLLHRFRLTRLDGEAVRDALLAVSGRLDRRVGGPPVPIHLTPFLDGRGRPGHSGPVDGDGRRSLYLGVRRNFLSPFLLAFDTPIPFSTVGRRQSSNVPAQALILLNDPFVHGEAARWGGQVMRADGSTGDKVKGMWLAAFGRPATAAEADKATGFVAGREADPTAWADLAHALVNVKEFSFVR